MCNIVMLPKGSNLHFINGITNHVNYQKVVKICKNSVHCVSNAVETALVTH
jgi:hypothetical protein